MNFTQTSRQMAGCIVAFGAIGIFVALTIAGHFLVDRPPEKGFERGSFAVVQICVQDEGPWGCLERLEKWSDRVEESKEFVGPKGSTRTPYIYSYKDVLMKAVAAGTMFADCPLSRKDECAARMISFGYDRSGTMDLVAEEPAR
jgi:hypothetical protein